MTRPRTSEERAEREARRQANKEAWARDPRNVNYQREQAIAALAAETTAPNVADSSSSTSLAQMRAIMGDATRELFRRVDAAEIVVTYELAPGAAAGVDPDQIAAGAYRFLKAVSESEVAPESLRFRALKNVVAIENTRKAAVQSPAAYHENREFSRRLINSARSSALREAGVWQRVVSSGANWALKPSDSFDVPALLQPGVGAVLEKDGSGEYLDACVRWRRDKPEEAARRDAERTSALLSVKATNRPDDWESLLN